MHSGVQAKADKSPVTVADYGTCWILSSILND
jgi:3'-phosphoadenosine 5'-phosphosulfate (PAPS) 3'-phosphatase